MQTQLISWNSQTSLSGYWERWTLSGANVKFANVSLSKPRICIIEPGPATLSTTGSEVKVRSKLLTSVSSFTSGLYGTSTSLRSCVGAYCFCACCVVCVLCALCFGVALCFVLCALCFVLCALCFVFRVSCLVLCASCFECVCAILTRQFQSSGAKKRCAINSKTPSVLPIRIFGSRFSSLMMTDLQGFERKGGKRRIPRWMLLYLCAKRTKQSN